MKFFNNIIKWFIKFFNSKLKNNIDSDNYTYELVMDVPTNLVLRKIFIVKDGNLPELLAFKCPCGCEADIFLNLLNDASPLWNYNFAKNGNINVYPSVWRKIGCKSHFFIRNGKIDWV